MLYCIYVMLSMLYVIFYIFRKNVDEKIKPPKTNAK